MILNYQSHFKPTNFTEATRPTASVPCTGLDPSWIQLTTEATFPVETGTMLTVSCEERFLLKGSNTITCTEGTTFSSTTTPTCVELGEFSVLKCTIDPRDSALREREKIERFA